MFIKDLLREMRDQIPNSARPLAELEPLCRVLFGGHGQNQIAPGAVFRVQRLAESLLLRGGLRDQRIARDIGFLKMPPICNKPVPSVFRDHTRRRDGRCGCPVPPVQGNRAELPDHRAEMAVE